MPRAATDNDEQAILPRADPMKLIREKRPVVAELIDAELSQPAPRGGYIHGLAQPETDPKIKAALLSMAQELNRAN